MRTCIFAGTFDPPTKGHLEMIKRCQKMFDKVVVAVGLNPNKTPLFSVDERLRLVRKLFENDENVEVVSHGGLLVDLMKNYDTLFYVRGLRNEDDYKYETTMAYYNEDMYPEMITVFLPTPKEYSYVSSAAMRELIKLGADFSQYIPEAIKEGTKKIIAEKTNKQ